MANMLDYLDWRGDLSMTKDPFNEVDNLILAELSYIPFNEYMPKAGSDESVRLKDVGEAFFEDSKVISIRAYPEDHNSQAISLFAEGEVTIVGIYVATMESIFD